MGGIDFSRSSSGSRFSSKSILFCLYIYKKMSTWIFAVEITLVYFFLRQTVSARKSYFDDDVGILNIKT